MCFLNHINSPNINCQIKYNIFISGRSKYCIVEEKIISYSDEKLSHFLSQQEIYPFKFIHSNNETNKCLFGSLPRYLNPCDKTKSFIDQIKELSNSKTYTWTLKYTSKDKF